MGLKRWIRMVSVIYTEQMLWRCSMWPGLSPAIAEGLECHYWPQNGTPTSPAPVTGSTSQPFLVALCGPISDSPCSCEHLGRTSQGHIVVDVPSPCREAADVQEERKAHHGPMVNTELPEIQGGGWAGGGRCVKCWVIVSFIQELACALESLNSGATRSWWMSKVWRFIQH